MAGSIKNKANSVCSAELELELDWAWEKKTSLKIILISEYNNYEHVGTSGSRITSSERMKSSFMPKIIAVNCIKEWNNVSHLSPKPGYKKSVKLLMYN